MHLSQNIYAVGQSAFQSSVVKAITMATDSNERKRAWKNCKYTQLNWLKRGKTRVTMS